MPPANYEEPFDESYVDLEEEPSGGSSSPNFGAILRMLQRRLPVVAGVVAATTSAAYLVASSKPPLFVGSFQLQVEPASAEERLSEPLTVAGEGRVDPRTFQVDYPTQIAILRSPRILGPIINDLKINDGLELSVRNFLDTLQIVQSGNSRILSVEYQGSDRDAVLAVLNRLSEAYLKYSLNERKTRVRAGIEFITERQAELEVREQELSSELESMQRQYTLFNPAGEADALVAQKRIVEAEIDTVEGELAERRQHVGALQNQLGIAAAEALDALALSEDPQYAQLNQTLFALDQQIAQERSRFTDDSPTVLALTAQRQELLPLLQTRASQLLGARAAGGGSTRLALQDDTRRTLARELVGSSTQIGLLETRLQQLKERAAELGEQAAQFPTIARRYTDIQEELLSVRSTLSSLFDQEQKFSVLEAQNEVPWEVISEPFVLDRSGGVQKLVVAGVGGGLFLGIGIAYLLDRRQDVTFDEEDIADISNWLATVPDYVGERPILTWMLADSQEINHAKEIDPDFSEFLETFNSLYARLLLDNSDRVPLRSLGVTSAERGDGKTTVAVFLAYAIASAGKSVLLVDANLRSPCLHERLGLPNEQGLKQLLDNPGQALKQKSLLQSLPISKNLRVLTAGGTAPNAAQLLASEGMSTLMQKFRDKFDFVIYDTPQFQGYADAQYICDRTNGLLVVTQLLRSKRSAFKETLETLQTVRLNVLGTLANASDPKRATEDLDGGLLEGTTDDGPMALDGDNISPDAAEPLLTDDDVVDSITRLPPDKLDDSFDDEDLGRSDREDRILR